MIDIIKRKLQDLKIGEIVPIEEFRKAQTYYLNGDCQLLTQAQLTYDFAIMETVMNQGMQFLAGFYKMSTGKEMTSGQQKVEIDKETGEVVMRFKLDI
ncbi:MAG: hypothetical protein NXI23_05130 [Bacteroidetes bacterium]|jgi:hypothetical protein|nr:hypothetical protein [Bacteroidota bacterium]MDF1863212.1 hypothetical protein [Saprospiraceae bacterium]